jgi:geranylgeranyl reductase family protein
VTTSFDRPGERVDAIVVGGGPAGAMAAMELARRGIPTLVLERKRPPRDKPCGGGMRHGVFRRFPELAGYLRETVEMHEVRKVRMESPSGISAIADRETPLYVTLRRVDLDAALLERARDLGARVLEGVRVVDVACDAARAMVTTSDGTRLDARVVIGADGVNSVVARAAGLMDGTAADAIALDTTEETPVEDLCVTDPDTLYVAWGYKGGPGYAYVFPKRRHVDAGVGFLVSYYRTALGGAPYPYHEAFLEEATAKGIVTGRSRRENCRAYRLPIGGPLARTYGPRVLVAGDAGGFVNAYTGEGIYHAMVTGQLAGEAAAEAIRAGDCSEFAMARYQVRWEQEIGEELRDSVRIQRRLFGAPDRADRIIRAASVDPKLCRLLAAVALGEEPLAAHRGELAWRFAVASLRARLRTAVTRLGMRAASTTAG